MSFHFLDGAINKVEGAVKDVGHATSVAAKGNSNPGGGAFGFLRNQLLPSDPQLHAKFQEAQSAPVQIAQSVPRAAAQLGLTGASLAEKALGKPQSPIALPQNLPGGTKVFGSQPIQSIQEDYAGNRQTHGAPFSFLAAGTNAAFDLAQAVPAGTSVLKAGKAVNESKNAIIAGDAPRIALKDQQVLRDYNDYLTGANPANGKGELTKLVSDARAVGEKHGVDLSANATKESRITATADLLDSVGKNRSEVGAVGRDVLGDANKPTQAANIADKLVTAKSPQEAFKTLTDGGVDPVTAKRIAPAVVQTKDPNIINNIITRAHTPPPTPEDIMAARTLPSAPGPSDAAQKVLGTLGEAQKTRDLQEAGYSAERSAKLGQSTAAGADQPGLAGHYAELSALKGELSKQNYEGLSGHLPRQEQDDLFAQLRQEIKDSPNVAGYGKLNAAEAVRKVVYGDAGVPTNSEITLLHKVFGENFAQSIKQDVAAHNERLTAYQNFGQKAAQVAGLPRELMATADFSGGLRQGLAAATRHPLVFAKEFGNQFKYFASEGAYNKADEAIYAHPDFPLLQQAKIAILDVGNKTGPREEKFISSLGEKIPVLGKLLHASNRAYTGLLNNMRANIFYDKIATLRNAGYDFNDTANHKLLTDLGKVINTSTGRGDLGRFEAAGHALSTALFAPRLIASRLSMLDPRYYINLEGPARKEALTTLASLGAFSAGILSLAELAGAKVSTDPTNADFGKARFGDTRIDPLGGYSQYLRLGAQLAEGKKTNSTTGATTELGKGIAQTRWDVLTSFVTNKEAPVPSFATTVLKGKDGAGNPINYKKEVESRFIPLIAQDIKDLYTHDNAAGGSNASKIGLAAAGALGVGLQTYSAQDNPLSAKQTTYIDALKQNGADQKTIKASTAFFQDLKEASGTRTNVNTAVDKALAANDLPKAQRLADQYNKELLGGIAGWNQKYGQYATPDLQQAFNKQKINLSATSVNSRLKTLNSTKPY